MANAGSHETVVQDALRRIESDRVVERMWQRDPALWPQPSLGAAPAAERLGWLTLPDALPGLSAAAGEFAADARAHGFSDAVLLGMGGSSLGPEVMRSIMGGA
ncbi:MAG: transaldolase, partial [Chloroflexi bacterium]|nr:transaldolase [Chloroflexota bacterium]